MHDPPCDRSRDSSGPVDRRTQGEEREFGLGALDFHAREHRNWLVAMDGVALLDEQFLDHDGRTRRAGDVDDTVMRLDPAESADAVRRRGRGVFRYTGRSDPVLRSEIRCEEHAHSDRCSE